MFGFLTHIPVADVATGFLTRWSPRGPWTLIAQGTGKVPEVRSFALPIGKKEAGDWIDAKQRGNRGLLFLVGVTERAMHTPVLDEHLTATHHIAVSLPCKPRDVGDRLKSLPQPTAVIDTGRATAIMWTLRHPAPKASAMQVGAAIAERCGGTLAWLVPLPGTRRVTGELVRLLSHKPSLLYTLADLGARPADGMRVRRASEVQARPIDWMWPHMLARGELTIVAGFGSAGKTTMCLSLAAAISRGGPFPDGTPSQRGGVLVIEGEDSVETVTKPRLMAAGADLDRVHVVDKTGEMLTPAVLDRAAAGIEDLRFVVLSPLRRLIRDNQASNDIVRERLEPLVLWAQTRNIGMIGVMHPQKGNTKASADALAGSAAYTELSRMVHLAAVDETDPEPDVTLKRRELRVIKSNNSPPGIRYPYHIVGEWVGDIETSRVEWQAQGAPQRQQAAPRRAEAPREAVARAGTPRAEAPEAPATMPDNVVPFATPAEAWLSQALAQGARPAAQLKATAPAEGVPVRSLHRGADRLGVVRYRDKGTQMWRLP